MALPGTQGFTMHDSGFWFKNTDRSGPYVYDGNAMALASMASVINDADTVGLVQTSGARSNAVASASLPAVPGKRNYISGFEITGTGATLGSAATAVLDGVQGGPIPYIVAAPAGILNAIAPLVVSFRPAIPAIDVGVAITLTLPALGLGNLNASVAIHGYQR